MDVWVAARPDLRATSRTRAIGVINTHIRRRVGPIQIGQFTRLQAQQWAAGIPGSPETVRKVVNVLSGALQLAVDDGRLPANPAQRLKLPKRIKTAKRYLSHDEVAALALAVGRRPHRRELDYDRLILLMAYCGLRWGELSGLRIQDLHLPRARLQVKQTVVADKGYQRIGPPKDYWFDPAATEVGLDGITPHELRHTAASLAGSAGAHVKSVQRMLGHASAAMTLDTYADLFDDDLDNVASAHNELARKSDVQLLMT